MRPLSSLLVALLAIAPATADVLDDFENGTNHGNWLGVNQNTWLKPTGGNPDWWLNAVENMGEPLFQFLRDPGNVFAGDYVAEGVSGFSVDLRADAGFSQDNPEGCGITLRLYWTNGGQYPLDIEAWYAGDTWPKLGTGWKSYMFPLPAASPTIPDGWTVYRGDGSPGVDADWQYLMHNIDQVQIQYGEIGYMFPIRSWNIGMDNVRLLTVPEPATALALLIAAGALLRRRG